VLAHGDCVVATARRPEQLRALVDGHADRARVFPLDVTDADAALPQSNSRLPNSAGSTLW
jgi:NADP-dependent 3-hydroxy acid dehydrogenase YdfG